MADSDAKTCPSCGARLSESAEVCDLCGAQVNDVGDAAHEVEHAAGAYCNACGWKNPSEANFCSRCGARLQRTASGEEGVDVPSAMSTEHPARPPVVSISEPPEMSEAGTPHPPAEENGLGRRVLAVVGVAVLVVAVLFALTTWSSTQPSGEQSSPVASEEATPTVAASEIEAVVEQLETEPLPPALADSTETLRERIAKQGGAERQTARRSLVALYLGVGQPGHAALVQQHLAEDAGTALAWQRAGNLFLTWMNHLERSQKPQVAPFAAAAYERVLALQPNNLDAKTNLAWAIQFDAGRNPMRAIQLTNAVLEADPEHLQANFNKGRFYLKINRLDDALAQFEKVRRLAGEDSRFYEIAGRYIDVVEELKTRRGSEAAGGTTRTS